jgi:hypothetical protein
VSLSFLVTESGGRIVTESGARIIVAEFDGPPPAFALSGIAGGAPTSEPRRYRRGRRKFEIDEVNSTIPRPLSTDVNFNAVAIEHTIAEQLRAAHRQNVDEENEMMELASVLAALGF